ncbi:Uncharacterised protein [Mycobacteroides abscessus subsp. abscessus]|nr:Uncharacterised protein [Mycobacteroides abscessus subsp. abscessus]
MLDRQSHLHPSGEELLLVIMRRRHLADRLRILELGEQIQLKSHISMPLLAGRQHPDLNGAVQQAFLPESES